MTRLNQIWIDPELPDSYEGLMRLILLPTMSTVQEYAAAEAALSTMVSVNPDGSPGVGMSTQQLGAAQNWWSNTQDWWSQTWSGDWAAGAQSFSEGWDAFWSGNFS
jgi:hypothetical protein